MAEIRLSDDVVTLVSDEDRHWLSQRPWYLDGGYATLKLWQVRGQPLAVRMHRLILLARDNTAIIHLNGDKLDNRRENLHLTNAAGVRALINGWRKTSANASRYHGVFPACDTKTGKRWIARIVHQKKRYHLGTFASEEEAARKYNEAARALHGDLAVLNIIDDRSPDPGPLGDAACGSSS